MILCKKLYCRGFQIALRVALPVLPYRNPKVLNRVEEIPAVLKQRGLNRPLLVTDQTVRSLGLTASLEQCLKEAGFELSVYDRTEPNPTTAMVTEAENRYRNHVCDCLIAFGGGSPMDCAKAVGARIARPKKPLSKMSGILKVLKKTPLLIAVPTTAGTGSETTLAAVITDAETRHKYAINDFPLIPSYAVLDASITHTLPYSVAATTGMDALTHAVEAYIGRSTSRQTRADAKQAVALVFQNIEAAAAHESTEAEQEMLRAAHLAGRAFTRSYVGYVHAVSHSLSGQYNMPHGLTNAVLLPIVLERYGTAAHKKLAELARFTGLGRDTDTDADCAARFITKIRELNKKLGIPEKLSGIAEKDIPKLAAYAEHEGNPLYPVPVLWGTKELEQIYFAVMEENK
ncbi:MAG: iron-containing alcohol dehydrogenase [Lachnospiraceae bacterium]